jgi:hypothetical protein
MDAYSLTMMVATLVAGILMALSGLEKHALERKHRRRHCPACGRNLERDRSCGCVR